MIHNYQLTKADTIFIKRNIFDELALEYRNSTNNSISIPFFINDVLIEEDFTRTLSAQRIAVIKNDPRPFSNTTQNNSILVQKEIVYRCGWCGNIVAENGDELESTKREKAIEVWKQYGNDVLEKVHGYCCRNLQS